MAIFDLIINHVGLSTSGEISSVLVVLLYGLYRGLRVPDISVQQNSKIRAPFVKRDHQRDRRLPYCLLARPCLPLPLSFINSIVLRK